MKKVRFIKQHDAMQCGIACLSMISHFHGRRISLSSLEALCTPTAEGVSMLGITDAARNIGLDPLSLYAAIDEIPNVQLPCILHWNQNHFVVLNQVDKDIRCFKIVDPAKGHRKISRKEFEEHWISPTLGEGVLMQLTPNGTFYHRKSEEAMTSGISGVIFSYLRNYRKYFIQILAGLLLGCVLQLIFPFLTQSIVDIGIRHNDISFIWLVLLGELMIVTGRTATDFIRRWLLLHISMRINISLVSDFFIKLLRLPMAFFDTRLTGDILQRISDHSRVQNFLTGQLLGVLFGFISFIVFSLVLFIYDKTIFGVFILASTIYAIWITRFLKQRKTIDYELFEQQARDRNLTYQFITNMQGIKLHDCEKRRRWEWEDIQADLFGVQMKALKMRQTQEAGSIFINEVKNMLITVLAATAVINGHMTLGAMLAIQYIIGQLNSPLGQLMSFIYSMQDVKISLERINEIHGCSNEEDKVQGHKAFTTTTDIEFKDVVFRYDMHDTKNTIDGISLNIPQGKVTAIVGASGSGKTTLIKLILGYYKINQGMINIAGKSIDQYSMKWWRQRCGVVMQDGVIFSESIARNIAVDDGEIDLQRLENAAQVANIHSFITSLPLGYDTRIGKDGIGLSQGQKQRILIARAVYRNPDFIFLDEATNALDARNEKEIVDNLARFYQGRTVVVVAHRLSTVTSADNIVVLDNGRIVESGDHRTLTQLKGIYYNLVRNQLELGT